VRPPQIPTVKNITQSDLKFLIAQLMNIPRRKQPNKFAKNVPQGKPFELTGFILLIMNRILHPIPPPIKTKTISLIKFILWGNITQ